MKFVTRRAAHNGLVAGLSPARSTDFNVSKAKNSPHRPGSTTLR
jgi:hypothetical protein